MLAGGGVITATHLANVQTPAPSPPTPTGGSAHATASKKRPLLRVTNAAPTLDTSKVSYSAKIEFRFSTALKPHGALPSIALAIAGAWSRPTPKIFRFTPSGQLIPREGVPVTFAAGSCGPIGVNGAGLRKPFTTK